MKPSPCPGAGLLSLLYEGGHGRAGGLGAGNELDRHGRGGEEGRDCKSMREKEGPWYKGG